MSLRRLATVLTALALAVIPVTPAAATGPGYELTTRAGSVIRWNPCVTVHYRVNLALAPAGALADVKAAVSRLQLATGITFVYSGTTRAVPQTTFASTVAPGHWPPLTIAWATPSTTDLLRPRDAGVGGIFSDMWFTRDGRVNPLQVVSGFVVMNAQHNGAYRAGFGAGTTRGEVLLHELGHAVGLQHVRDRAQMMFPAAIPRAAAAYGKGDLAGLRRVGRAAGCILPRRP